MAEARRPHVPGATAEGPGGRPAQNPTGSSNMDGERDRESSPNANFGPAPPQKPSLQHGNEHGQTIRHRVRQARNSEHLPPQASEIVCID
jgi:hypothetical protein